MKREYSNYLNNDHSFDKKTMLGIISLVFVFSGYFKSILFFPKILNLLKASTIYKKLGIEYIKL